MDRLTKKEVPAFMFLIYRIKHKEHYLSSSNKPKEVAKLGSFEDYHKAGTRTIRRAFRLYDNLCAKRIVKSDYNMPCRQTLDVLAQYYSYYEGKVITKKSHVFEYFKNQNNELIQDFYSSYCLSKEELDIIFTKELPKISKYRMFSEELKAHKKQIAKLSLDDFRKVWLQKIETKANKESDDKLLQENLVAYLNKGIDKGKFIFFWYSIIGTLIFVFVHIPEYGDLKDYIFDGLNSLISSKDLNYYSNSTSSSNEVVERKPVLIAR